MRTLINREEKLVYKIDNLIPGFLWLVNARDIKIKWRILNLLSKDDLRHLIISSNSIINDVIEEYEYFSEYEIEDNLGTLKFLNTLANRSLKKINNILYKKA